MASESLFERSKKKWKKLQQRARSPRGSPLPAATQVSAPAQPPASPIARPASASPSPAVGTSKSTITVSTSEVADGSQDHAVDLWGRAFEGLSKEAKKWIQEHNLDLSGQTQPEHHIKEITRLIKSNTLSVDKDGNSKVDVSYHKIVVREYIAGVVNFLTMAGDVAVNFAPPQASAPWAIAKAVLQIPVKHGAQMTALAGTVQWFTRIVRRGQLYELLYNHKTTDKNAVLNLHDALTDVYVAAIELLARSDTLVESGVAKQTLNAVLRPDQATGLVADLVEKEQKLLREVPVCEASRSEKAGRKADEKSRDLLSNLDKLTSPLMRIDENVADIREMIDEKRLRDLLKFISPAGHGKSHVDIADSRIDDTGNWLIEHEGFRTWQAIPSSSTILWLKGTVGTGKTYLTWRAIEYVKTALEERPSNEGFAFFYCSRLATSLQDPLIILRSFVRQLFDKRSEKCYNRVKQKREMADNEVGSLGLKDCKELILEFINLYSHTTIILDALDEASPTSSNQNLAEILIDILNKAKKPVKLFISSRPDREYLRTFEATATVTIESKNQQADIEKYLEERLYSSSSFKQRQMETQTLIRDVFSSRMNTMFRWIHLQVQRLNSYTSHDAVKSWATTLPNTLTEAYDQLFDDMRSHNEHDVALAERAIKWVVSSNELLTSEVLLEAIRYSLQDSTVVQKDKQTEQQILTLCRDLLTIEPREENVWVLPHASVAEYFELKGITLAECDLFASKVALSCLIDYKPETIQRATTSEEFWTIESFEQYVIQKWFTHVGRYDKWLGSTNCTEADPELVMILKRFLGSLEESSDSYRRWINNANILFTMDKRYENWSLKAELLPENIALFAACRFGFYYTLGDWWDGAKISKQLALEKCELGHTPLVQATRSGCLPIFQHLIRFVGTDYPVSERYNAMKEALDYRQKEIATALMTEAEIDVNAKYSAEYPESLVQGTVVKKHETLQWLIDQGWVDVHRQTVTQYGSLLTMAAHLLQVNAVEILLKAGANPNALVTTGNGRCLNALAATASIDWPDKKNFANMIQLLLDYGADANQPLNEGQYGSAFEKLITMNHEDPDFCKVFLEMLLKAGTDPSMVFDNGFHGSALAAAAFCGLKEILIAMITAVTRDKAIQCLQSSRHPEVFYLSYKEDYKEWMERRRETMEYLTKDVGVNEETLRKIGLWDVMPEDDGQHWVFKFK